MDDIINKLDDDTKRWYLSNEVGDILSALIIGKEIFTSSYYKTNKDQKVNNMISTIESLKDEYKNKTELLENGYNKKLQLEKIKNEELTSKFNIDNRDSINIAVEHSLKYANDNIMLLTSSNNKLKEDLEKYKKIKDEFDDFKCNMNKSKIKGELTEIEVKTYIEEAGFITEKPGINSGDLFVYSKMNELICVLEIKNYGENNKHKLGPNGTEVKKMYNDIETQLNSDNKINVPWLFISLGCEIPNMGELRDIHDGVNCIYLSEPSYKEMLECIKCCVIINKLNNTNGKNDIYIQSKLNEIKDIFMLFSKTTPNFKKIKTGLNKSIKDLEKEEDKFNKYLTENTDRINSIFNDIEKCPNNKKIIDFNKNIEEMKHKDICDYVYKIKEYCKLLECSKLN